MSEIKKSEEYLQIQINEEIIKRFKEANLEMDLMGSIMFILFGLFEGKEKLLDCADDGNKQRRMIILYRQLERKGFIERMPTGSILYKLTHIGTEFVTFLQEQYTKDLKIEVHAENFTATVKADTLIEMEVAKWINDYVNAFPDMKVDGKVLRQHPIAIINKMKNFVKRYGYSSDIIIKATKLYIEDRTNANDNHRYTRNSSYFISKDQGDKYISDLATWCKKVIDMEEAGLDPNTLNKMFMDIV